MLFQKVPVNRFSKSCKSPEIKYITRRKTSSEHVFGVLSPSSSSYSKVLICIVWFRSGTSIHIHTVNLNHSQSSQESQYSGMAFHSNLRPSLRRRLLLPPWLNRDSAGFKGLMKPPAFSSRLWQLCSSEPLSWPRLRHIAPFFTDHSHAQAFIYQKKKKRPRIDFSRTGLVFQINCHLSLSLAEAL